MSGRICTSWRRVNNHSSKITTDVLFLTSPVLVEDSTERSFVNWVIDSWHNFTFSDQILVLCMSQLASLIETILTRRVERSGHLIKKILLTSTADMTQTQAQIQNFTVN